MFEKCSECGKDRFLINTSDIMGDLIVSLTCRECGNIINFKVNAVEMNPDDTYTVIE